MHKEQNLIFKNLLLLLIIVIPLFSLGISNHGLWSADEPRVAEIGREMALTEEAAAGFFQYTPPGGSVCISAQMMEHHVKVTIADSGQRIKEEDLPQILTDSSVENGAVPHRETASD